ncbi:hypothetical protein GQ457_02G038750 [Hibiscus cannabinus]
MYVTSTLSNYRRNPIEAPAVAAPREPPCSGLMVLRERGVADEEEEGKGLFDKGLYRKLPLPSNAMLLNTDLETGKNFLLIPVLDQPLSSNRYYVIHAEGKYKGLASKCSSEDDMADCCFTRIIQDVKPKPFDHRDESQRFQICSKGKAGFIAKPLVPRSFPPVSIRSKFFIVVENKAVHHLEDDAKGLDGSARSRLPELGSMTNVMVGKWYTPFVFVKEGSLKESKGDVVALNVEVKREANFLFGVEVLKGDQIDREGFIWFGSGGEKLRLNSAVSEAMRWLEESVVGWTDGVERVERLVEISGGRGRDGSRWRRFNCYVLVERFALRRMDGTLVLNCDFRHTHEIQTRWE